MFFEVGGVYMFKEIIGEEVINISDDRYSEKREYLKSIETERNKFKCPICREQLVLHWALIPKKNPHFKHKRKNSCIYGSGESQLHMDGKRKLFKYFRNNFPHKTECIEIEHYIKATKQIADIYIRFNNGNEWVVEYQRSNVSIEEIRNRKHLYNQAGIKDIWIAGENLISEKSLAVCSVLGAGQDLIYSDTFTGAPSFTTFNPTTNKFTIIRGLQKMNNRSFTYDDEFEYYLEDICFNYLIG